MTLGAYRLYGDGTTRYIGCRYSSDTLHNKTIVWESKMKITFVHAAEEFYDQNYGTSFIPLWAFYLSSFVPESWDIGIVDCRLNKLSEATDSNVFAFGGINQSLQKMLKAREKLAERFPDAKFIIGGPITWSFGKEDKLSLLDSFDHIFILDGEQALPDYLNNFGKPAQPRIIQSERFPIKQSKEMSFRLYDKTQNNYYGAVVEVSRGCPFLCEFCDIRVLPENNQSNNKPIDIIIKEIDEFQKRGIHNFQFACDNFIGDIKWATECVDAILAWKEKSNASISIFTWLTINIYNYPDLMRKMRLAGFGILFIGIESVNKNSLLETAKVQNLNLLSEAVEKIQSYGFVIAPGFIFGFDSDNEETFDDTLNFIKDTGCVGGDPSFLMALAGTPLFHRMQKSGRLIESDDKAVERKKISTNIRYLQDKKMLAKGFLHFVNVFTSTKYQWERINNTFDLIVKSENFVGVPAAGSYASVGPYLMMQLKNRENLTMLVKRLFFLARPDRFVVAFYALVKANLLEKKYPGVKSFFSYWAYNWTNMVLKYGKLEIGDFGLHSVDDNFDYSKILENMEYNEDEKKSLEEQGIKVSVQAMRTKKALEKIVNSKKM